MTLWCYMSQRESGGRRGGGVLLLRRLAACLPCLSAPPRREWGREGKAETDGWLAIVWIMNLSTVCWSLNLVPNDLSCAKWLLGVCEFSPCCTLASGEDSLPPPAVEGGWAYLRVDSMKIPQRFLGPGSVLWLLSLCDAAGAEQKGMANNPAPGP